MGPIRRLVPLALAACMVAAPAFSAGSAAITIGATIVAAGNCRFDTPGPTALDFGAIDPSSPADATVSASIPYRCSGGGAQPSASWTISSNDGQFETGPGANRMRHALNTSEFLRYSLNVPASATVPKNINQTFVVVATILVADFQNAIAGTYTDTVVLTMAP